MAEPTRRRRDPNAQPLDNEEAASARNPAGTPGRGRTTAEDVAHPRQKEVGNEGQKPTSGFTGTGPSGSAGGRATYGTTDEDEDEP